MHAIKATWTNGRIVPAEPVDWPEGSELLVAPLPAEEKIGLDEAGWEDSPEAIADWAAWLPSIEPLDYTEQEQADFEKFRDEARRFNVEAVRRQMDLGD